MTNQQILDMFAEAFLGETVQKGQRLRLYQVAVINAIALEIKERKAGVAALRKSTSCITR